MATLNLTIPDVVADRLTIIAQAEGFANARDMVISNLKKKARSHEAQEFQLAQDALLQQATAARKAALIAKQAELDGKYS